MNNSIGKTLILLGTCSLLHAGFQAPSSPIFLENKTSCSLNLSFQQTLVATLELPNSIPAYSSAEGHIEFFSSMFVETNQQQALSQYVVNCDGTNHILSLDFFAGIGNISIHDYFFQAKTEASSPFLIIPAGRVLIQDGLPLTITLLNKEEKHEKNDPISNPDTVDVNSDSEREDSNNQPDTMSDIPPPHIKQPAHPSEQPEQFRKKNLA